MGSCAGDLRLSDLCTLIVDCEHKTAPLQADGYPSIRTPNIGRGYFILDGVNRVSEETYLAWTRRAVPRVDDLVMAREAPVGNVARIPDDLKPCLGQRTLLIRPDVTRIDPAYLVYLLVGPIVQAAIRGMINGATVPHLNMKDVRSLRLPRLPDIPSQRRIAGILSAYDDLIENCKRRIRVLDEMARALYREWFVNFRYPGHEKMMSLVESAIGQIPRGWTAERVDAVAVEARRSVPKGALGKVERYVGLEHIPRRSLALDAWEEAADLGSNKLRFEPGEVLFGKIRPYFHKVSVVPFAGVCSADTFVISAREEVCRAFVTCLVSSDEFVAHASATANGAKMPRANWDVMMEFSIALPPRALFEQFSAIVDPWLEEQRCLVAQAHNLRKTRDLLLPRLLSGELSVAEAA